MFDYCYKVIAALWADFKQFFIGITYYTSVLISIFIEATARKKEGLKGMKAIIKKGVLFILSPFIMALMLIIPLVFKISRYIYKWLSYGTTALRALFDIVGQSKEISFDDLEEAIETAGFAYDPDKDIFYSIMNPWQRNFGYCRLYDEASAPLNMIIDSDPIYFEYSGKKWLIEVWKGQYGMTTGGEIGVYNTQGPELIIPGLFNGTFYNSANDEDLLQMSYVLKKNNKTLITREDKHWWLTGFKLGEFSEPSQLSMRVNITLIDRRMRNAFIKGLNDVGYSNDEIMTYGNTVSFNFDKPKTRQPFTRMRFTDWIIQRKNQYLCNKYQEIVGPYDNLEDKLKAIQIKAPKLFAKVMNIGKTKGLYKKSKTINDYFN